MTQLRVQDESYTTRQKAITLSVNQLPRALEMSVDDKARNAFFFHYVSGFSRTYDVLESLYKPVDSHLGASLDAVSLAFFAFRFDHAGAAQIARVRYANALPLVYRAVKSPESVMTDSTLLAVLFLDLFEKMTDRDTRGSRTWMSHVNGGLALAKLRGRNQLTTYTGLRLSIRLFVNLVISCVCGEIEPPTGLDELRCELESFVNKNDPKWRITGLVLRYTSLRAAIQKNALNDADIVYQAKQIDSEYATVARSMPHPWCYETKHLEETSERVLEQHYTVYRDHLVTQTWNVLRSTRISLNDLIRKHSRLSILSSTDTLHYIRESNAAANTIDSMAYEICASVPSFTLFDSVDKADDLAVAVHRSRCYTLLFPLYVAGSSASRLTNIKQWTIDQLNYLSSSIGIQNAALVSHILNTAPWTNPWVVYNTLGSYAFAA
ncbi:MAG: hypothetical protein Q9165_007158 [Trypethelium subeluteriae]